MPRCFQKDGDQGASCETLVIAVPEPTHASWGKVRFQRLDRRCVVCPSVMVHMVIIKGRCRCHMHDGLDIILLAPLAVPERIAGQAGAEG